ncbi:MarR family transcriptional regulator [Mycobacterium xenopi]|uniref:MarR family transcriptional regulator n=1 Tax=Mycobacterium xenopi TaxID=1789 RepID=UPI0022EA94BC|nr:MarR family transcriptional regulator [Mycobacterium xenopi]MDA3663793.1 MarR family transcriptional regulator [Mycobacterium xenopi]
MSELTVLQAVRLKGQVTATDLAVTLGVDPAEVADTVERLAAAGLVEGDKVLKLSRDGRTRLGELLAEERKNIDEAALLAAYNDFRAVNADFKAAVTDWQLKDGEANTHQDAEYDAAVLARIADVHQRVLPIIAAAASELPRLNAYSAKLQNALDKVKAGDATWLTRPLIDSYHTVWFELHEELIGAAGLTREAEAKAGNAQ